jgi:hypothetical protein
VYDAVDVAKVGLECVLHEFKQALENLARLSLVLGNRMNLNFGQNFTETVLDSDSTDLVRRSESIKC